MSADVVRFDPNERVDLADLLAAVDTTLRANARDWGTNFLADPSGDRSWVLDGFVTDNADGSPYGGTQVRVTKGRAILGQREGGQTIFGALTSEGDATRIIDVGTFSSGTYGVYVRFELLSGESSSRAFWDPTGDGEEIAQTIPTRRLANWSVRIELTTPGAEWLRVSTVVIDASPVVTGITDLRDLYFDGTVDSTYASGWSTEGGGVANDRNSDRQQYGVADLHTFTQATRQCLEDIKGRGLRRWWSADIGGMNIGFDAAPVEDQLAVGDAEFGLFGDSITTPRVWFDGSGGSSDYIQYTRSTDTWSFVIAGIAKAQLAAAGLQLDGGLLVNHVGGSAVAGEIQITDGDFKIDGSTIAVPAIGFDSNDFIRYTRASNLWDWVIASTPAASLEALGLQVEGGVDVGFLTGSPIADRLRIADANFYLLIDTARPTIQFNTGGGSLDFYRFDRAAHLNEWYTEDSLRMSLDKDALNLETGVDLQVDNYRWDGGSARVLDTWVGPAQMGFKSFANGEIESNRAVLKGTGSGNFAQAPFIWPKGARITEWRAYISEGGGETVTVNIMERDWNSVAAGTIVDTLTGSGGGGDQELTATPVNFARTDNKVYTIRFQTDVESTDVLFYGAEIQFAFDEVPVENWSL